MTAWFVHGGSLMAERVEITVAETTGRGIHRNFFSGWWRSALDRHQPPFLGGDHEGDPFNGVGTRALRLCGARDEKADPVGTWKCEYKIGDQKRTLTLTIKKDGDKLAGTMTWPDQKDEPLKDVKLKDGTVTFSNVRKFQGKEIAIDYTLKIDGDTLKGKAASQFGGQKQEWDLNGKREKKDK